jgi:hypothetical protein
MVVSALVVVDACRTGWMRRPGARFRYAHEATSMATMMGATRRALRGVVTHGPHAEPVPRRGAMPEDAATGCRNTDDCPVGVT